MMIFRRAARLVAVLLIGLGAAGAVAVAGSAGAAPLDIGGWQLLQFNSTQTYTFPAGTVVPPGGYVIVARFATRGAFESYYTTTLGANVLYFTNPSDNPALPSINGAEVYELRNAQGTLIDGPTPPLTNTVQAWHRTDPEAAPWTSISPTATPGAGVEPPDEIFSGLVITEANNAASYTYEFIELYYDAPADAANSPPVITDVAHLPAQPSSGGALTVTARVTDPDGTVAAARCFWRAATAAFTPLPMAAGPDDVWSATISPLPARGNVDYFIQAEDDLGASARSPFNAPADYYAVWVHGEPPPGRVVLFDHAHGQSAGTEGNWRIDDNFPDPLPAAPQRESDWSGQLSSWAYELHLAGHTVRSNTTALTPALLDGVDLLVIVEPQNQFSAGEIAAVGAFVHAGGSLFAVANHNGSDRDGDGWDSASILGGYSRPHISEPVGDDVETFCGALFGLHFHVKDEGNNSITGTFANVDTDPANPLINGPYGSVGAVIYHVGNVMSLWPLANPDLSAVAGHIWKDGDAGNPDVNIAAWSRYGAGKVVGYGDSSSCADGTDSEPHANNWTELGSNNREFFLNATSWLLARDGTAVDGGESGGPPRLGLGLTAAPNPFNPTTSVGFTLPAAARVTVVVHDAQGRAVRRLLDARREAGRHVLRWDGRDDAGRPLPSGLYLVRAAGGATIEIRKVVLAK